jgi:hypothetical protein
MKNPKLFAMVALILIVSTGGSRADDTGISGRKLVILFKPSANRAKLVFVSKGDPAIHKGSSGDPQLLTGGFEWSYTNVSGSVSGAFVLPSSHWTTNTDVVAKFSNPDAFSCVPTCTKVAVIKPGRLAKLSAKLGGDSGTGDFLAGGPDDTDGVITVFTITNGNDASTHHMCTRFAVGSGSTVVYKEIAQGTGRKLVAKNGVPTACP